MNNVEQYNAFSIVSDRSHTEYRGTQYLTGAHNAGVAAVAFEKNIGLMLQPGNRYDLQVEKYPCWVGDNGAFTTTKKGFSAEKFREMLRRPMLLKNRGKCLFVVAPDKLVVLPDGKVVGDARGTLEQFSDWAKEIRALGYPVAFVAQNGLETMLDEVPWELVDVLFLGGGPDPALATAKNKRGEWKESAGARACVIRAAAEGKRTHMGRVNGFRRMNIADDWGVDTVDGTYLAFGPDVNLPKLLSWIEKIGAKYAKPNRSVGDVSSEGTSCGEGDGGPGGSFAEQIAGARTECVGTDGSDPIPSEPVSAVQGSSSVAELGGPVLDMLGNETDYADAVIEDAESDWAPLCRFETCSPGNITCVSKD